MGDVHAHPERSGGTVPSGTAGPPAGRISRRTFIGGSAAAGAGLAALPVLAKYSFAGAAPAPREFGIRMGWPVPLVVSRAQWGADEGLRIAKQAGEAPIYDSPVTKLIVHHTVTPNNTPDPAAMVRSIYNYHVSGVYIDIAYNFLIDQNGFIYEGRWSKDLVPGQYPDGENLYGMQVRGAHALNTNTRSIGIALLGTFSDVPPSTAQVETLITVCAWKCARWGIDPLGASQYVDGRVFDNITGHRDTSSTECPGNGMEWLLPHVRQQVANRFSASTNGYWIAMRDGTVRPFGDAADFGDPRRSNLHVALQDVVALKNAPGTWLLGTDGGIFTYGGAQFYGSTGGMPLNQPVVGMAARPQGDGYWLVASDGGVFSFGKAKFHGSTGAIRLNQPVVGMAATPSGKGYWLVARDGGIFTFGDARFFGSTGNLRLNQPIVGMAPTANGQGYFLCAADGGIFAFGNATYRGSTGGLPLASPIVDFAVTPSGNGYWMLARDGGVWTFGDAPNHGNAVGSGLEAVGFAARIA